MSQASKVTLALSSVFAIGTIAVVHFHQKAERAVSLTMNPPLRNQINGIPFALPRLTWVEIDHHIQAMHQGVLRDIEQQRVKRERQLDFDMQRALEEEYKRDQTVRSSLEPVQKPSHPESS
jgi:protein PET117